MILKQPQFNLSIMEAFILALTLILVMPAMELSLLINLIEECFQ